MRSRKLWSRKYPFGLKKFKIDINIFNECRGINNLKTDLYCGILSCILSCGTKERKVFEEPEKFISGVKNRFPDLTLEEINIIFACMNKNYKLRPSIYDVLKVFKNDTTPFYERNEAIKILFVNEEIDLFTNLELKNAGKLIENNLRVLTHIYSKFGLLLKSILYS